MKLKKKSEIERKTNQLLSEIDENTENWARRRNTINKVRLDLNEFEKLDPFFILRSEKAKRLNDLESKDGITEEESQEANNLKEELELLSTNETQFELSNNSLKKRDSLANWKI